MLCALTPRHCDAGAAHRFIELLRSTIASVNALRLVITTGRRTIKSLSFVPIYYNYIDILYSYDTVQFTLQIIYYI